MPNLQLLKAASKAIAPPQRLLPSEWAVQNFRLSPEASAEPGNYHWNRAPYQREMLDAIAHPDTKEVVVMASAQTGKSTIELILVGYLIDLAPCPMLWVAPTLEMAEATSKDRLAPMFRDSPCFKGKIKDPRSRDSGNTLLHKALAVDTPIPTPSGWKQMGDIVVGDKVFDENGNPCNVTYVTPVNYGRPCYKVVFSDGSCIVADYDHPWQVERWKVDKKGCKPKQVVISEVVTTADLIKGVGGKRSKYSIPVTQPLILPEIPLEVDPYILGAWLGDGYSHAAVIVAGNEDADEMQLLLKSCGAYGEYRGYSDKKTKAIKLDPPFGKESHCVRGHDKSVVGVTTDGHCPECRKQLARKRKSGQCIDEFFPNSNRAWLDKFGILKEKLSPYSLKAIPSHYLRASFEQRLSLLQGLMDTDGTIRDDGHCVFVTTLDALGAGVSELLHSLGLQHTVKFRYPSYNHNGEKKNGKRCWAIGFTAPFDFDVFRLTRKLERQKEFIRTAKVKRRASTRRQVVDVVPVDSVPVRCISVDSPTHLYLAGNAMIPTHNTFPGGQLVLAGANSPASLASRPIQTVLIDEADRFPLSAGTEGDPIALAKKRTTTFWNRMVITVSTPTVKGVSRIEKAWELSDQRRYYVPCPHCGFEQPLSWDNLRYQGKGELDRPSNIPDVLYFCGACGAGIEEHHKAEMLAAGYWQAGRESGGIVGFHLNELYSPWKSWHDVALDFEAAKSDPMQFQVWVNTSLGEPFEPDTRTRYDWENLLYRSEESDYSQGSVPAGLLFLTAGVDVQGDRLEVGIFGWGEGEEWGLIGHYQVFGVPTDDAVWEKTECLLNAQFDHPLGGKISVSRVFVDTGFETHEVYGQVRMRRNWFAVKGVAGDRPIVGKPSLQEVNWRGERIKKGIKLYTVGIDKVKEVLLSRCRIDKPGPKYLHLPQDAGRFWCQGFAGSEVRMQKHRNGHPYYVWETVQGVRNEPLDCAVYAFAAAIQAGINRPNFFKGRREILTVEKGVNAEVMEVKAPEKAKKRQRRSSYLNGFGGR